MVTYVATPADWCPNDPRNPCAPPPQFVLSRHASLPYQSTLNVDRTATDYTINATVLATGEITCAVRIGRVSVTGHGTANRVHSSPCTAGARRSARLGHVHR
jgi:hypothetical protein